MGSLSAPFRKEAFRWQQVTTGVQQQQARMQDSARAQTNGALGEAVGQDWIKRNFSPEAKARAAKMVDNLVSALARSDQRTRLDERRDERRRPSPSSTRSCAKSRIPTSGATTRRSPIKPGSYYENQRAVAEWNSARTWARLGKAPERDEWSMTPPTVNASYSSSLNQIQFPAGILQPPFFDPNADDAVNYGALGAVIGHEMTHGFDDSGRQFDAQGNLARLVDAGGRGEVQGRGAARRRSVQRLHGRRQRVARERPPDARREHRRPRRTDGRVLRDGEGDRPASRSTKIDGFTPEQRFFLGVGADLARAVARRGADCSR